MDDEPKRDWLKYQTSKWEKNILAITKSVGKYTQKICKMVVHVIQLVSIFLQHVTKDTGHAFAGVGNIIYESFSSRLFFGKSKLCPPLYDP